MENAENGEEKQEQDGIVKITITKEAGETLASLVERANEGFDGGKINRQNLASFIIEKFKLNFTDKDLTQLRQSHYDDTSMMEAMYRRMKETGELPDFLRDALRKQFYGIDDAPKKSKKALTREYTNDVHEKVKESA